MVWFYVGFPRGGTDEIKRGRQAGGFISQGTKRDVLPREGEPTEKRQTDRQMDGRRGRRTEKQEDRSREGEQRRAHTETD